MFIKRSKTLVSPTSAWKSWDLILKCMMREFVSTKSLVMLLPSSPMHTRGLIVCKRLSEQGIKVNVTLIFSAAQAVLAAKAGATYVSPFVGHLDDQSWQVWRSFDLSLNSSVFMDVGLRFSLPLSVVFNVLSVHGIMVRRLQR